MNYKLILADFDDTLKRTDDTVHSSTVYAIKEYQKAGGHFAICTGRMLNAIVGIAKSLNLSGDLIASQGSVIYSLDNNSYILNAGFDYKLAAKVCRDIDENNEQVRLFINDELYVNMNNEATKMYAKFYAGTGLHTIKGSIENFFLTTKHVAEKIVIFSPDGSLTEDKAIRIANKFKNEIVTSVINENYIEIVDKKYTKGTALEFLAKRYNVPISKTIAIGDSLNDYTMIKTAGRGIAVSNAVQGLKDIADEITLSCDENAVEHIIKKYGLGETL